MTGSGPTRHYRLFDRVLESPVEIPLLQMIDRSTVLDRPVVSLRLDPSPLRAEGEMSFGGDDWPVTYYVGPDRDFADFRGTDRIAVIDKSGMKITLHPKLGTEEQTSRGSSRRVVDSLVTGVLSGIPILWGQTSVHGATLVSPIGTVLLVGESGHGKSTLSQVLQSRHAWRLLDDDSAMIDTAPSPPRLVPMGAAARLRRDAAAYLNLQCARLPGYSGGKMVIPSQIGDPAALWQPAPLPVAIFCLDPSPEVQEVTITRLPSVHAVEKVWKSVFASDHSLAQKALRFRTTSILANEEVLQVSYQKERHNPDAVAVAIVSSMAEGV